MILSLFSAPLQISPSEYFVLVVAVVFLLGLITGGLSNLTSGGAGIFTIFVLTNLAGLVIQQATGTVLAASTIIVLVGTMSFWRRSQVHKTLGLTVGVSGVVGAFLAARWASSINGTTLEHFFGAFTLALAGYTIYMFTAESRRAKKKQQVVAIPKIVAAEGTQIESTPSISTSRLTGTDPASLAVQITKGVLIGVATGLFGVGLASLSVVLFMILFKLDTKMILGTSLFASIFRYAGGSIGYLTAGEISPFFFVLLVIGGGIGSIVGARMVLGTGRASKDIYVKIIIVGILIFVGYEYLLKDLIFGHLIL